MSRQKLILAAGAGDLIGPHPAEERGALGARRGLLYNLAADVGVIGHTRLSRFLGGERSIPLEVGLDATHKWSESELTRRGRLQLLRPGRHKCSQS